jgi:hypothetical protein
LELCPEVLRIFLGELNRLSLENELRWAKANESDPNVGIDSWTTEEWHLPFPFVLPYLTIGTSFDASTGYYQSSSIKRINMNLNEGDNNTGITVLDITDLSNVCYCFMHYYRMSNRPVQLNISGPSPIREIQRSESIPKMDELI